LPKIRVWMHKLQRLLARPERPHARLPARAGAGASEPDEAGKPPTNRRQGHEADIDDGRSCCFFMRPDDRHINLEREHGSIYIGGTAA
jgi:hypothetical protein